MRSSPGPDRNTNGTTNAAESTAESKAAKKEKARLLADQIRRMQMQLDELDGDISRDEGDDP